MNDQETRLRLTNARRTGVQLTIAAVVALIIALTVVGVIHVRFPGPQPPPVPDTSAPSRDAQAAAFAREILEGRLLGDDAEPVSARRRGAPLLEAGSQELAEAWVDALNSARDREARLNDLSAVWSDPLVTSADGESFTIRGTVKYRDIFGETIRRRYTIKVTYDQKTGWRPAGGGWDH